MNWTILAVLVLGFSGLGWGLWAIEKRQSKRDRTLGFLLGREKSVDLSPVTNRLEELHQKLEALAPIARRIAQIETTLGTLPGALQGVREEIKLMFERWEENALPEEAKRIGSEALSRVARARAQMEKDSEDSLLKFNEAVAGKSRSASEPIIVRDAL